MSGSRGRLVAVAVFLAAGVLLVVVALATSGGGGGTSLRLERDMTGVIVSVAKADNVPENAGGRRRLTLECLDSKKRLLSRTKHGWPLTDTDRGTTDPHTHVNMPPDAGRRVERCRFAGTELEGRLALR